MTDAQDETARDTTDSNDEDAQPATSDRLEHLQHTIDDAKKAADEALAPQREPGDGEM